jgi:hypothetical protein
MATKIFRRARAGHHPTDHYTRYSEFRGVQFAPRGLVINVPNIFNANSGGETQ